MKIKKILVFFIVIICLSLLSIYYPDKESFKKDYEKESCFVDRVIDGDTLICNNETIRLLGINTPEKKEYYYEEAKIFLQEVEGKEVRVLRDFDDLGKYKRKLRYVFYGDRMINIEILEQGFGFLFMAEGLKYEDKLILAEDYAKVNCNGLWKSGCLSEG